MVIFDFARARCFDLLPRLMHSITPPEPGFQWIKPIAARLACQLKIGQRLKWTKGGVLEGMRKILITIILLDSP